LELGSHIHLAGLKDFFLCHAILIVNCFVVDWTTSVCTDLIYFLVAALHVLSFASNPFKVVKEWNSLQE
jgi:hypothetical protein